MGYRAKNAVILIRILCNFVREIDNKIIARSQLCCDLFYQCERAWHRVKENFDGGKKNSKKFSEGEAPEQDEDLPKTSHCPMVPQQ